ncbi:nicotinate phosphoribosyltransferase [Allosalinactinospora lopnorensis]|uniref:nicotinate phosphoribosyltransferase n=1 Tax=Allosalinactinospora lopnorensis TaxID=1352348 RepID=UPI000A5350AB|nr:nicotinate phosphoribosyltransferase [Allosalinactinospora lopnorensis]
MVDFSFRRTQGIDAGMSVARACAIAGFAGTSNVEAARRFGLPTVGTMAHSFVEAFATEEEAFTRFVDQFPDRATFLVDTYDTMGGVRTAISVARRLGLGDRFGVRLDSGDMTELSMLARAELDAAGLPRARIFASGGLDEYAIDEHVRAKAPIDAYGVGTKVGVSADAPYLDSAYKLVEFDGRPVMKLSSGKVFPPGAKQVFRGPHGDRLCLRHEPPPPGWEPLLRPAMRAGERLSSAENWQAARDRLRADAAWLPPATRALRDPAPTTVEWSRPLHEQYTQVRTRLSQHVAGPIEDPVVPPRD